MTDDRTPPEDPARDADQPATEEHAEPTEPTEPSETAQAAEPAQPVDPARAARPAEAAATPGGTSGWAIAALVVGIGAFLVGLVPVVGLLVALVGIALAVVALVRRRRTQPGLGLGITGIALSGVAALTNVAVLAVLVVVVPLGAAVADRAWDAGAGGGTWSDGTSDDWSDDSDDLADVSTSCWSFTAPADSWTLDGDAGACRTSLEVADGWGTTVDVVTVPASVSAGLVPAASADRLADGVTALGTSWLPGVGTVVGEPEQVTLDGQPAALVRLVTGPDLSTPAAAVVAWSPADATGASSLTLATIRQSDGGWEDGDTGTDTGIDDPAGADRAAVSGAAVVDRVATSLTTTWRWTDR